MNNKSYNTTIAGTALGISLMLSGCGTPPTHRVAYNLSPYVARASARDTMKASTPGAAAVVLCVGPRSESRDVARVSAYHCEGADPKERLKRINPYGGEYRHVLQAGEPIGKYIEQSCAAALTSKGIRQDSEAPNKLLLQLERFDYDEFSDQKHGIITPLSILSDRDGALRKGFLDVVVRVQQADGTIAYQRRISVEVARKRGQASSTAHIASLAIGLVSPVTLDSKAIRAKEEKTIASDVITDLFTKFQDELVADEDLLQALRK